MSNSERLARQKILVSALAATMGPSTTMHETHISWVLVAGDYAYKLKKAVQFDFVDFSTLESRHFYCREELRLNSRLAPDIYLEVVAITGDPEHPTIGGAGPAIEYAVKMRAFDQGALWTHRIEQGQLSRADIDGLAESIATFHARTAIAAADSPWCSPQALQSIADETLAQIDRSLESPEDLKTAAALRAWEVEQRAALHDVFGTRKADGHIRECHGDLHSGNILTINGRVEAFDCIEFNDGLRWIDVMNDIAFICMDLRFQRRSDFAARLLNRYVERTGDVEGLRVLRYYEVHRALIRCKVALLRKEQCVAESDAAKDALRQALAYLAYASARSRPAPPALFITHGFSGCGKSTVARQVVEETGAIQLRSDIERKRMYGIEASSHTALPGGALYDPEATRRTYERLHALALVALKAGWPVIVDATFLRQAQRQPFMELASSLGVPFVILDVQASEETMRSRITARLEKQRDPSDATVEVLALQLCSHDAFTGDEQAHVVVVDTETGKERPSLLAACAKAIAGTAR